MTAFNGIQQLGVGVENLHEAWAWYRKFFGMDICMFEEEAVAELMLAHTEGKTRARHAVLALNMEGGGGFEVWQHTGKTPIPANFDIQLGDHGISIGKLKSKDVDKAYWHFKEEDLDLLTEVEITPNGKKHFYLKDPYKNIWEVIEHEYVFAPQQAFTGGILGVTIGVKDMEESLVVYRDILSYDVVEYDETKAFDDLKNMPAGDGKFRRVLLSSTKHGGGAFSPMLGPSQIELIQALDREGKDIFEGRIWGDPGFIHLCYDINGMDSLREEVKTKGYPFTVDSAKAMETFDMGEAAGNFAYIQAPEGTLLEFVETHKIPLLQKIGWYLNLRKRGRKPLPNWMFRLFKMKRVK